MSEKTRMVVHDNFQTVSEVASDLFEAVLGVLPRKRLIVAHGVHYLEYARACYPRVLLLEQEGFVRRPLNDSVEAVGGE